MYKNLLKKFIGFSLGNWITVVISLLTTPIITRIFLPDEYGKFSMYNLIVNLLLLFVLMGNDQSYMRFYTEKNKASLFKKAFNSSLIIFIFVAVLITIFKNPLSTLISGDITQNISNLIIIGLGFQFILRFLQTDVRMRQNAVLFSGISVTDKVANVIFTLIFAKIIGATYSSLILALIGSNLIAIMIVVLIDKNLSFKSAKFDEVDRKELIKYGLPFMSSLLVFWLFQSFDKLALKYLSDYGELGIYAATMKLVLIFNIIQNSFVNFWTPVSLEKYESDDGAEEFFKNMFNIVSVTLIMFGVVVIMFADLSSILLGKVYEETANVLPFLIFIPILYTVSETTVIGINFLKKTGWHVVIAIISSIVNISLNILLIPSYGAKGAALATAISYVVFYLTRTAVSKKLYKVDYDVRTFNFNILILFLYASYASFTKVSVFHFLFGVVTILLVIYSYKTTLKKFGKIFPQGT